MATEQLYLETCKLKLGKAFEVPEFTPPHPARRHPLAEKAIKHANTWLLDHSVQTMFTPEKFARLLDCAMLATYAYPEAPEKGLNLGSNIMLLTWAMDDMIDDCKVTEIDENWQKTMSIVVEMHLIMKSSFPDSNLLSQQLMEFLEKLPSNITRVFQNFLKEKELLQLHATKLYSPIALAYHDYWKEVTSSNQGQQSGLRAASYLQDYFFSSLIEMYNRQANVLPSIEEYVTHRRQTGAVIFFLVQHEILQGVTLVEEIWRSPEMQRLLNATNDFVTFHNDIWSYKKEYLGMGNVHNMVFLISHYSQCSAEEAALTVIKMLNEKCQEVETAAKELLEITEPKHQHAVNLYIQACWYFISGTHEFHKKSLRYEQNHST